MEEENAPSGPCTGTCCLGTGHFPAPSHQWAVALLWGNCRCLEAFPLGDGQMDDYVWAITCLLGLPDTV